MLKIAICDDSRSDVERLEQAFDELHHSDVEYDVYFSAAMKDLKWLTVTFTVKIQRSILY